MSDPGEPDLGTRPRRRKLGPATMAGVVLGAVVVCAVVCSVPLVAMVRTNVALARSVHSAKHMETLVHAIRGHMADHGGCLPQSATWDMAIERYVASKEPQALASSGALIYSPSEPAGLGAVPHVDGVPMPATWIILRESGAQGGERVAVGFLDGKVQVLASQEVAKMISHQLGDS